MCDRAELLEDLLALLRSSLDLLDTQLQSSVEATLGDATPVDRDVTAALVRLRGLMSGAGDPAVRHNAFMLLQAAGAAPPSLFREHDDEVLPAVGKYLFILYYSFICYQIII